MDKPKKVCPADKIINPLTLRCVLKTGAIGKKLLKNKLREPKEKPKREPKKEPKEKPKREPKKEPRIPKREPKKEPRIPKREPKKEPRIPKIEPKKNKYAFKRKKLNDAFRKFINPSIPDLNFSDKEIDYISNPFDSKWRNQWLYKHHDIHHICDAYACIGGDTIQFMSIKPKAKIDSIQITNDNRLLISRYNRLVSNIKLCSFLNSNVHTYPMSITDFILNEKFKTVDFLYCDPPWTDIHNNWYDCSTLISILNNDIFKPLIIKKYKPKYICFKVPFEWLQFKDVLNHLKSYKLNASGKFHWNGYWMHIIQLK